MRAGLILAVAGGALIAGLTLAAPAEASHGWSFGAGFHVGGVHFRIGFGPPVVGHYGGPFFLTTHQLHYRGARCHGACFRRGGGFYHHAACPVVGLHFRRGGHSLSHHLHRHSPYRGYGNRGYSPYEYRYRHDRYGYRDRHYDSRDRRYRWEAPRYRQHDYWRRYRRDWDHDSDSDSDSDRRRRGRGRGYRY